MMKEAITWQKQKIFIFKLQTCLVDLRTHQIRTIEEFRTNKMDAPVLENSVQSFIENSAKDKVLVISNITTGMISHP